MADEIPRKFVIIIMTEPLTKAEALRFDRKLDLLIRDNQETLRSVALSKLEGGTIGSKPFWAWEQ